MLLRLMVYVQCPIPTPTLDQVDYTISSYTGEIPRLE